MLVLGISGSLRTGSYNTALLRAAGGLLPPAVRIHIHDELALLPPYSEDHDVEPAPVTVATLRARLAAADALLFSTPEYNGSVPGQLKNAIDWASRPYPDNVLREKPVAVIGASTGIFGAVWAQADLRKILTTAGAQVLERELTLGDAPAAFDPSLGLTDPATIAALREVVRDLVVALAARRMVPARVDPGVRPGHAAYCVGRARATAHKS